MRNLFTLLAFTLIICLPSCHSPGGQGAITIVFYNCENLFDTLDNPATADEEFTPEGNYRYSSKIYEQKLHNIATVFHTLSNGRKNFPAIIGLAEIENIDVLKALVHQPELERINYQPILIQGHDIRGINVAMLYDPARLKIIATQSIPIKMADTVTATRDILYVTGVAAADTLHIFVNHWPSRRHDDTTTRVTERILVAQQLRRRIDSIRNREVHAKIIVMGDFNDNPNDSSLAILGSVRDTAHLPSTAFYNPFDNIYREGHGTEYYRGTWNLFDQVLLSQSITKISGGLHFVSARICQYAFMTDTMHGQPSVPYRSFKGAYWLGGFSDHFPVVVDLETGNVQQRTLGSK